MPISRLLNIKFNFPSECVKFLSYLEWNTSAAWLKGREIILPITTNDRRSSEALSKKMTPPNISLHRQFLTTTIIYEPGFWVTDQMGRRTRRVSKKNNHYSQNNRIESECDTRRWEFADGGCMRAEAQMTFIQVCIPQMLHGNVTPSLKRIVKRGTLQQDNDPKHIEKKLSKSILLQYFAAEGRATKNPPAIEQLNTIIDCPQICVRLVSSMQDEQICCQTHLIWINY